MQPPRRIVVVGRPGAGKSTLARKLSERLGLPVVHLDKLWWRPGWVERDIESFDRELAEICAGESWIIDGNYGRTFDLRMAGADTLVWMDRPRWLCLLRICGRILSTGGRVRPDMGEGCPERLDFEFLQYVWDFRKNHGAALAAAMERHKTHARLIQLKTGAETEAFLKSLG